MAFGHHDLYTRSVWRFFERLHLLSSLPDANDPMEQKKSVLVNQNNQKWNKEHEISEANDLNQTNHNQDSLSTTLMMQLITHAI
jgi:hypothetical protein